MDYATHLRQQWLAKMQRNIDLEELAYWLSERIALIVVGVMIYGIFEVMV